MNYWLLSGTSSVGVTLTESFNEIFSINHCPLRFISELSAVLFIVAEVSFAGLVFPVHPASVDIRSRHAVNFIFIMKLKLYYVLKFSEIFRGSK